MNFLLEAGGERPCPVRMPQSRLRNRLEVGSAGAYTLRYYFPVDSNGIDHFRSLPFGSEVVVRVQIIE